MNKNFTLKAFIAAFVSVVSVSTTKAQEAASATWSLLEAPTATVAGNITASEQTLGPLLSGVSYNTGYGTTANNNQTSGWQRVGTTSGIRSTSDSAFNQGSYVEYSVTPTAGNHFQVNSVSVEVVGGGTGTARLAAMYSLNGFASMDSFGVTTNYNGVARRATRKDSVALINGGSSIPVLTGQQILAFNGLSINVAPGQTFTVRFYVWLTGASTTARHLGERNVVISGMTSSAPFPVTFASHRAFEKGNGVQVEWTSATETNVSKYIVEKSSNGRSFNQAAALKAVGNSTVAKTYSWFDASPSAGANFYRIIAQDADGRTKQTSIMKVNLAKGASDIAISPNPVRGGLINLQLSNIEKGVYTVNVYSSNGQKVYTKQLNHDGGAASQLLQVPSLKQGVYNLQLSNNTMRLNKSVIVE